MQGEESSCSLTFHKLTSRTLDRKYCEGTCKYDLKKKERSGYNWSAEIWREREGPVCLRTKSLWGDLKKLTSPMFFLVRHIEMWKTQIHTSNPKRNTQRKRAFKSIWINFSSNTCRFHFVTHLSSDPVCRYLAFPLVLYFPEANLRLHFWRQTGSKPGWLVTHFSTTSCSTSWRTISLFKASTHPSNSLQQ